MIEIEKETTLTTRVSTWSYLIDINLGVQPFPFSSWGSEIYYSGESNNTIWPNERKLI